MAASPGEFSLLQHRLYVEIVDPWGRPCAPGERGEIVVTGGFNRYVPMLRYRTGDYASMEFRNRTPILKGLEGRSPVVFQGQQGQRINNIDVTLALWPLSIPQFRLHQNADRSLKLSHRGMADPQAVREIIEKLFGAGQVLEIERIADDAVPAGKLMQYTTDLEET
jgi:phenylacetate-CoA ligase